MNTKQCNLSVTESLKICALLNCEERTAEAINDIRAGVFGPFIKHNTACNLIRHILYNIPRMRALLDVVMTFANPNDYILVWEPHLIHYQPRKTGLISLLVYSFVI